MVAMENTRETKRTMISFQAATVNE